MVDASSFIHVLASVSLLGLSVANKKAVVNNSGVHPAEHCGLWVKEPQGGRFTSPHYPRKYPPDRECIYILEAEPRQCIDLYFDEIYSVELSWECKFDHIEVRDGPFSYSPMIGRYCGQQSPPYIRSSGRYLWIKFVADGELEATGFSARYNFTADPDLKGVGALEPLPICEFELEGPEGLVDSKQISRDNKAPPTEAVDCKWFVRAPPHSKIYLRFLDYEMQNSNECKRNFVAVYDGSASVVDLRKLFCSTVATDVTLASTLGVVRMWADEGSRRSHFTMLFTTFQEPPCARDSFFCHSNMCINSTLVCNGVQNCAFPWDENRCKEKKKAHILDKLTSTNLAIIGVTCGVVLILLIVSVIVQIRQPRKKYLIKREPFSSTLFQEVFDPPHYELCALRPSGSAADLAGGASDFEPLHRWPSSRCIHDHHCGSQATSPACSRSSLGNREINISLDGQPHSIRTLVPPDSPAQPIRALHSPVNHRNIKAITHSHNLYANEEEEEDSIVSHQSPGKGHHTHGACLNENEEHVDHPSVKLQI